MVEDIDTFMNVVVLLSYLDSREGYILSSMTNSEVRVFIPTK